MKWVTKGTGHAACYSILAVSDEQRDKLSMLLYIINCRFPSLIPAALFSRLAFLLYVAHSSFRSFCPWSRARGINRTAAAAAYACLSLQGDPAGPRPEMQYFFTLMS